MLIECPKHGGSFDCSPFCNLCVGEQEISLQEPEQVAPRPGRPCLALSEPNIYQLLKFLKRDFGLTHNLQDNETEALRELQIELLQIAVKRES
jgi:hypothetical protein